MLIEYKKKTINKLVLFLFGVELPKHNITMFSLYHSFDKIVISSPKKYQLLSKSNYVLIKSVKIV